MDAKSRMPTAQDEVTLKDVVELLWRRRWLVFSVTAAFTVMAGVAAFLTPKSYRASIIVSPVAQLPGSGQSGGGGGLGSVVSQFSGLASLAGLSMGGDSHKAESVAVMQSETLTENYIRANNLLPVLYAKKWDAQLKRWKVTDPKKIPTVWKANQYFKRSIRSVSTDTKTGLVTVTIDWRDPELAAKWANDLVRMSNDYLRTKTIAESERNIEYLNMQALKTDAVGVKQAIYQILQNEINKEMLARGTTEYAIKVVDPAVAPEEASSPQKLMWVLIGMFGGLLICLFAAFVRVAWSKS
jgi:uncharacterized protein involved in exopolysaccharide biosynthesis